MIYGIATVFLGYFDALIDGAGRQYPNAEASNVHHNVLSPLLIDKFITEVIMIIYIIIIWQKNVT